MDLIIRKASVRWKGGPRGGTGAVTIGDHICNHAKLLSTRLKHNSDTDAVELIAAAHASSFCLALSNELKLKPFLAGEIATTATVTVERLAASWCIQNIHLNVVASLPNLTEKKFIDAAVRAKTNCLIARSLPADISISAKLENRAAGTPGGTCSEAKSLFRIHKKTKRNIRNRNLHLQIARNDLKHLFRQGPSWSARGGRQ